jgi:hypothetical protein
MRRDNHPVAELELMAYLDGELPRERAAGAAAHLEECGDCQRLAKDLREVSEKLAAWKVEPFNGEISPSLSAAFDEHRRVQEAKGAGRGSWRDVLNWRPLGIGAFAAVVLVLLVISLATPNMLRYSAPHSASTGSMSRPIAPPRPSAGPQPGRGPGSAGALGGVLGGIAGGVPGGVVGGVPQPQGGAVGSVGKLQRELSEQPDLSPSLSHQGPMIVRTAELALVTKDLDKARAALEEVVRRHRGYLGSLNMGGAAGYARMLNATLRLPASEIDAAINELKTLGRIESESQSGEEVTQQYVDLEARLVNARHTEQRLTDLLRERTGRLSDVLAVEQEIDRVRGEIERMDAEKKELGKRVAFATINTRLTEDYKAQLQLTPPSTSTRFRNAAVDGYQSVVDSLISLALFLISWGPSLLLWGALLFFPARFLWRRFRRDVV